MPADYIEDIKADHKTAFTDILKERKEYEILSKSHALLLTRKLIDHALKTLGVVYRRGMHYKMVDRILREKKVKVETRRYTESECDNDHPEGGVYIYQNSELCYFVSDVHAKTANMFAIDQTVKTIIATNVRLPDKNA